ncbi:SGNH/GDSL hydrolase family protein [Paramagnetospirillum caucaseum]|uniref:SGNH/GDSL hydrolase family protein n=1 Tax=Paramagnetospirillum caucaseum TaxID=1244869 RepID=UPI001267ECFE|nr:hypothetical protein [Paramagnetospirillum caucaseum]
MTVFLSVLLSIAVFELILQEFSPTYPSDVPGMMVFDSELGYRYRPSSHFLRSADYQIEFETNRLGSFNYTDDFTGYRELVFALGDSYTQGTGVPMDASYPAQLDLQLNIGSDGRYRKDIAVVNLGVSSYGTLQELITFRRMLKELGKPSFVLLLGAENDAEDIDELLSGRRARKAVAGSPYWGAFTPVARWILDRQVTILALEALRPLLISRSPSPHGMSVAERCRPYLEMLADEVEVAGGKLIVSWAVTQDHAPSYDWLRNWALHRGVGFADWWPTVQSVRDQVPTMPLRNPHSGGHFRTWVNQAIARAFAKEIGASRPTVGQMNRMPYNRIH